MAKVAVIGLGIMGLPMAKNLVTAGHQVTGYNRSPEKAQELAKAGGTAAGSVAEAVKDAEVIITMVPDSPDVQDVVEGADGVFANAPKGALWIDASTIRPDVAVNLAGAAREAGIRPLDAPVSGGEQGAINAALSIMVGGEATDFEAAQEVLNGVGKTIVHVGPSGSGQTVKAANQLIVAGNIQLLAESVVFLEAYVPAAAREAGVTIPLGAVVAQLVSALVARGDGGLDHSGLFKLAHELSGGDEK